VRHTYPKSEQTRQALCGIVKAVAEKMNFRRDYLDAILNGYKTDPYSPFRALFVATAKVSPARAWMWLNDLNLIVRVESARANLGAKRFTGQPREVRRETREAADAGIDERPVDEQIREVSEAIESLEERLLFLANRKCEKSGCSD
jgi:hypothetical protein